MLWRLFFTLAAAILLVSCQTAHTKAPLLDIDIYQASSKEQALVRKQEHESISCNEPWFDDFLCVRKPDMESLLMLISTGCRDWK